MTYTSKMNNTMPIPVEPAVISAYIANSASATDLTIPIPWKNCKLVHAESVVCTDLDTDGAMEIDLELNAAGGQEVASISVAADSSVGDVDLATMGTSAAAITAQSNLDRSDTNRQYINVEVDGSTAATGAVNLYLYFERQPVA